MGRHVISVVVTGDSKDFNRAMRAANADMKSFSKGIADAGSAQDRLNQKLRISATQIDRLAKNIKRAYPDVEGLGRAMDYLAKREAIRIKTIFRLEEATRATSRLTGKLGLLSAAFAATNVGAAAVVISLSAMSGLILGVAGGGLVGAFGYLLFTTEKWREEMGKVASFIRKDMINNTMKPFYDIISTLPKVVKDAYVGAEKEFKALGKALEPLAESFLKFFPEITKKIVGAFADIAKVSQPFFEQLLKSINPLVDGITDFFKAIASSDVTIMKAVLRDLGDLFRLLGESIATLSVEDYEEFKTFIVNFVRDIAGAIQGVINFIEKAEGMFNKFGTSLTGVTVLLAGIYTASKLLAIPIYALSKVWGAVNKRVVNYKSKVALDKLGGTVVDQNTKSVGLLEAAWLALLAPFRKINSALGKIFSTTLKFGPKNALIGWIAGIAGFVKTVAPAFLRIFTKFLGPIGLVVGVLMEIPGIISSIGDETTFLGGIWKKVLDTGIIDRLKAAWDKLYAAVETFIGELKIAWDEFYAVLEETGVIDKVREAFELLAKVVGAGIFVTLMIAIEGLIKGLEFLTFVVEFATDMFKRIKGVGETLGGVLRNVINFVMTLVNWFRNLFNQGEVTSSGIVASAKSIGGIFKWLQNLLRVVIDWIVDKWNWLKNNSKTIFNAIKNIITTVFNAIKSKVKPIVDAIKTFVSNAWNKIKSVTSSIFNAVKDKIVGVFNTIKSKVKSIVNSLKSGVINAFNTLKSKIVGIMNTVRDKIVSIIRDAKDRAIAVAKSFINIGSSIASAIAQGIRNGYQTVMNAVSSLVNAIPAKIRDLLGINSPAKVIIPYGVSIDEGLALGIKQGGGLVQKEMDRMFASIAMNEPELVGLWDKEVAAARDAANAIEKIFESTGVSVASGKTPVAVNIGTQDKKNAAVSQQNTYNITVHSNSPNVGREIVKEIQSYERVNGSRWRK